MDTATIIKGVMVKFIVSLLCRISCILYSAAVVVVAVVVAAVVADVVVAVVAVVVGFRFFASSLEFCILRLFRERYIYSAKLISMNSSEI